MFDKKFSEEMLNIKATDESKAKLLEKIEKEQEKTALPYAKKTVKKRWISVMAAAVALVIVSVSVFGLPPLGGGKIADQTIPSAEETITINGLEYPVINHQKGIPASVSHNQIYTLFSSIYQVEQARDILSDILSDGAIVYDDYGYTTDDTAFNDGNSVAKPGTGNSLKGENTAPAPDSAPPGGMGDDMGNDMGEEEDFSTTNTQVEGVDEADVVKTDGKYIYTLNSRDGKVIITSAKQGKLSNVASFNLFEEDIQDKKYYYKYYSVTEMDMYLCGDRIIVIYEDHSKEKSSTIVKIYNVSNPEKPSLVREISQSGSYLSSRVIDGRFYIFTNEYVYNKPTRDDKTTYLPCTSVDGAPPVAVNEGCIYMFDGEVNRSYLTASSVNVTDGKIIDTKTALGGGRTLYANTKGFYVTADASNVSYLTGDMDLSYDNKTRVIRFEIEDGKINAMAEGAIEGTPLNQFSMDEYGDYFRIVTTGYKNYDTINSVYILNKDLKTVGKITDIAKGERVYSVRFMGDVVYFVTFRQVDPLFAVDLSNPKEPKILSALKIPGFSNYMHPWGEGLLLGIGADANEQTGITEGVKLSMFDISDPKNVSEKAKEIIESIVSSDIGTNHKAILADYNKNLIGFVAGNNFYYLYGYSQDKGFELKDILDVPQYLDPQGNYDPYYWEAHNVRGIYIGDYFYVCSGVGINSYRISDFSEVDSLWFFA